MTCIAAKNGVMAADTQLDGAIYRVEKLFRLPNGGVAGGAGLWTVVYPVLAWLAEGELGDPPPLDADSSILIMRRDGRLWMLDGPSTVYYPLFGKIAAIGTGGDVAEHVMRVLGGSALTAVQESAKTCGSVSGPFVTMAVEK